MELPQPEADELGRPVLNVNSADISKAYRRISVLVHPDKNPGEDARKAFEALNDAHRKLRDPAQLVSSTGDKYIVSLDTFFPFTVLHVCPLSIQLSSPMSHLVSLCFSSCVRSNCKHFCHVCNTCAA